MDETFFRGLYDEHIEEASFLYCQRRDRLQAEEHAWPSLEDVEQRLEANLQGLLVGGSQALQVCRERAEEGDDGEFFAAVSVFCRQDRRDEVRAAALRLDPEDQGRTSALGDALKQEWRANWTVEELRHLTKLEQLAAVAAVVIGHRRLHGFQDLLQHLDAWPERAVTAALWAIGRLREWDMWTTARPFLDHPRDEIAASAALALLRLGHRDAIPHCEHQARARKAWPLTLLGLGGGQPHAALLMDLLGENEASPEALLALGLLGDPSSIGFLIDQLSREARAPAAARALHLITGAALSEEILVPEQIAEEELLEDAEERPRAGGDVELRHESGHKARRPSQNAEDWRNWYREHRRQFPEGTRVRNGVLFSPACLLDALKAEETPPALRKLAYEELVIRYGVDVPFEVDFPARQQRECLLACESWLRSAGHQSQQGRWVVHGEPAR